MRESVTIRTPSQGDGSLSWSKAGSDSVLVSGGAHPALSNEVAGLLGVSLVQVKIEQFADTEINVELLESIRGRNVYVLQPVCRSFAPAASVNDALVELALLVGALRRASAGKVTVVMPYYGYARQDRKMARTAIGAAEVARILAAVGVNHAVTLDLHAGQIQGFFPPSVPTDNLSATIVAAYYFAGEGLGQAVVVSPDAGGVSRAKEFRKSMAAAAPPSAGQSTPGLAMLVKQRSAASQIERMDLVGSIEGQDVILVDDMVDTAGTLCEAAAQCKQHGARRVYAFCTHGLLSGPAAARLAKACADGNLEYLVITNSVPQPPMESWLDGCGALPPPKLKVLSVAPLVAEGLKRLANNEDFGHLRLSKL